MDPQTGLFPGQTLRDIYPEHDYLPDWAVGNEAIASLAEEDLSFRCDVWRAQEQQSKRFLQREAERRLGYR